MTSTGARTDSTPRGASRAMSSTTWCWVHLETTDKLRRVFTLSRFCRGAWCDSPYPCPTGPQDVV